MNNNLNNIVQVILLALMGWAGVTINDLQKTVAVLVVRVESASDDRYRRSDASRDFNNAQEHRLALERRLERLEKILEKHR